MISEVGRYIVGDVEYFKFKTEKKIDKRVFHVNYRDYRSIISKNSVPELKILASALGIKKYSEMKKIKLVENIEKVFNINYY